jgi:hypothetical protein
VLVVDLGKQFRVFIDADRVLGEAVAIYVVKVCDLEGFDLGECRTEFGRAIFGKWKWKWDDMAIEAEVIDGRRFGKR